MTDDVVSSVWKKLFGDYSDAFLDHTYQPRNVGSIEDADAHVRHTGPCGDSIELWLRMESGVISEITFIPDGCEGTTACGSALTELARGKRIEDAAAISAVSIESHLDGLAEEHKHCAGLASTVLHKALGELIGIMRRR